MLLRTFLPLLSLGLAASLSAQVQVRSSSQGLLSVTFTDFTEFNVRVAGEPDEILLVLENAYTTAQSPLLNGNLSGFSLPFLDIDEFDISSWGMEVGAGTAAAGTAGQIDPRDLVIRFTLSEETPITTAQTVAFGIGGILSNIPFPTPDGLAGNTPIFFAGTNSPFRTNRLLTNVTLLPLNPNPAGLCAGQVQDEVIALTFAGSGGDRVVEFSQNLTDWTPTDLFIPADSEFTFPVSTSREAKNFYRLSAPRAEFPLTTTAPSVSGLQLEELGEEGGYRYFFNSNGTGEQFDASNSLNWDFTWTEESSPGITTVSLTFVDSYREYLNLQAPLVEPSNIAFYGFRTFSEGAQGRSNSAPLDLAISTASKPTVANTAPANLAGISGMLTQPGLAGLPVSFSSATVGTGPAVLDGVATAWSYLYTVTGNNTASLALTDGNGDFLRLFLTFQDGFLPDASASSSVITNAFGRTDNYFTLTTP